MVKNNCNNVWSVFCNGIGTERRKFADGIAFSFSDIGDIFGVANYENDNRNDKTNGVGN